MRRQKRKLEDLEVKANDCIDMKDYILVHKDHYEDLVYRCSKFAPQPIRIDPNKCFFCGENHGEGMQCPKMVPMCTLIRG